MNKILIGSPITKILHTPDLDKVKDLILTLYDSLKPQFDIRCAIYEEEFGKKIPEIKNLINRDFEWLKTVDLALFVFPSDVDKIPIESSGAYVELGYILARKIPVLILLEMNHISKFSPFIQGLKYLDNVIIEDISINIRKEKLLNLIKIHEKKEINI